jgi:diguanylate cyclase (GGDEF)-like protein/PAS domain S-box-containing protein
MRIRTLAALLILVALALAPFAAYYVPQTLSRLKASTGAQSISRAESTANAVEKQLAWSEATVALLADTVALPAKSLRDRKPQVILAERLAEAASKVAKERQEIRHLTVIDPYGTALLRLAQRARDGDLVFAPAEVGDIPGAQALFELSRNGVGSSLGAGGATGSPQELYIVAPMGGTPGKPRVALLASVNVDRLTGGLADSYWIDGSGTYLRVPVSDNRDRSNAFDDFPGLQSQLQAGTRAWWGDGSAIGWSRLVLGSSGRLSTWVGQSADVSGLSSWQRQSWILTGASVLAALIVAWLLGTWLAGQLKGFGEGIADGLGQLLQGNERARFELSGTAETRAFGDEMNALAEGFVETQAARNMAAKKLADDHKKLKRHLEQARDDQSHSRELVDAVAHAIYSVDETGLCTYCNPACLDLLGLEDANRLLGQNIQDMLLRRSVERSEQPKAADAVAVALREAHPQHVEKEVIWRPDGTRRLVEYWANPIVEDGRVTGALVALADITERRQAMAELNRRRERAERTLESIGDGIVTVDPQGTIDYMNSAAQLMLGWTIEQARGQPFTTVFQVVGQAGTEFGAESLMPGIDESQIAQELLVQTHYGAPIYLECSATPLVGLTKSSESVIVVFRDVTGAPRMAHNPQYVATHDLTTGLTNRDEFEARLGRQLAREGEHQQAICYMDLDRFRTVNDACGSVAGDAMLRQLASLVRSTVRHRDAVGRLGDDEIGIVLDHCPLDQALRIASQLRQVVEDFQFHWDDKTYTITASIGVVEIADDASDARDVIGTAEGACYAAKAQGGNRVKAFHAGDEELAQYGPTHWVTRLNEALEENGFRLFYQAVVPLGRSTGMDRVRHYELLLRMKDPSGNLANAASFLPFAERYNMIQLMDRWVVRAAFEWLATRPKDAGDVLIEVKLSEASVADGNFAGYVKTQLERLRVPPKWICFQMGAGAVTSHLPDATQLLRALRHLGFKLSLDDLGGRLLSAAQIRNLDVDFLRIDGSQTSRITEDELDRALVKAITEIARITKRRTIAKMVEQDEALSVLGDLGVDFAQGYAISKPRPLEFLKKDG